MWIFEPILTSAVILIVTSAVVLIATSAVVLIATSALHAHHGTGERKPEARGRIAGTR